MKHCENVINARPVRHSPTKLSPYSFLITEIDNRMSIIGPVPLSPLKT